jgi:hypothetical protein
MAANQTTNIYIYLARRDRSSVKILIVAKGKEILASRLDNPEILNLPSNMTDELAQVIYDNRMFWEPWAESADTFEDLRAALKDRGYTNIPLSSQPQITIKTTIPKINTNQLPQKITMIRKKT